MTSSAKNLVACVPPNMLVRRRDLPKLLKSGQDTGYNGRAQTLSAAYFMLLESVPIFSKKSNHAILQEEIESANTELNHQCDFLPKFHCELNPIERVWAKSKWYVRKWSDQTTPMLKKLLRKSFLRTNLSKENVRKYFEHSKKYAVCYHKGDSALLAKMSVKKKSHRTVAASEAHM